MSGYKFEVKGNKLVVYIEGRIDTNNAAEAEAEINKIINNNSGYELVFDAAKLEYISSAGLRVLMKVRKERDPRSPISIIL